MNGNTLNVVGMGINRIGRVWRFVEGLDLSQLLAEIKAVEGQACGC